MPWTTRARTCAPKTTGEGVERQCDSASDSRGRNFRPLFAHLVQAVVSGALLQPALLPSENCTYLNSLKLSKPGERIPSAEKSRCRSKKPALQAWSSLIWGNAMAREKEATTIVKAFVATCSILAPPAGAGQAADLTAGQPPLAKPVEPVEAFPHWFVRIGGLGGLTT